MKIEISALERVFELARSDGVVAIEDIRKALSRVSYDAKAIHGPTLLRQLREVIEQRMAAREIQQD
jgi:hypothetical protein